MRVIKFYQLSLALPLAVPALVWLFGNLVPENAVGELLAWTIPSAAYGGLPYALLALAVGAWIRDKPARAVRRLSLILPLYFLGALELFMLVIQLIRGTFTAEGALAIALLFGMFALAFGYGYAALVELLRWAGTRLRLIEGLDARRADVGETGAEAVQAAE
jgi:hypothetical protein